MILSHFSIKDNIGFEDFLKNKTKDMYWLFIWVSKYYLIYKLNGLR